MAGGDLFGQVGVELGESFEVALGVAAGDATGVFGGGCCVGAVARERSGRLAVLAEMQVVGIFLGPLQAPLFTVDT